MIKVFLITMLLVAIAFAGLGIKALVGSKGDLHHGRCSDSSADRGKGGYSCGCGGSCAAE